MSKKWLRHVFRVNTERFYIGAVSAPCKETLAERGIPNLTHMSQGSVRSLWGLRLSPNPGFFDRLGALLSRVPMLAELYRTNGKSAPCKHRKEAPCSMMDSQLLKAGFR